MAAPFHPNTTSAGAFPHGAPAKGPDDLAALHSSHDDIEEGVTAAASFVPPLAQRLVERFGLSTASVGPTPAAHRSLHSGDRLLRLWSGPAGLDDGHAFIEVLVNEFGLRPDPRFGDWPVVVEAFRVHDPKDNPPHEPDRLFQFVRVTYADGAIYVALYTTKAHAKADARANEEADP
jgi:hypothetical protein